jgi:hypothetical protein
MILIGVVTWTTLKGLLIGIIAVEERGGLGPQPWHYDNEVSMC